MDKQSNSSGSGRFGGKDLSLEELFEMFPDEKTATEWFESNIWPDGRACPHCGHDRTCVAKHPDMPYYCSPCKRYFSVKTGTVMERSKISYRKWAIATYLVATHPKDISSVQLGRDLGTGQNTAWHLLHRLRDTWNALTGPDLLPGPVEVDEAYFGGRETNKHADKRGKRKKVAVVGIKDRETGVVRAVPVPETTAARLVGYIESNVAKGAKIYTDEHKSYSGLDNHETVNHGDGEYVRGEVHINGMESVWALIRRGCNGTHHHMEGKHLHRYINEFTGRLNMRALSTVDKMRKMVRGWVGKRPAYRQLVAGSALCGQP